MKETPFYIVIDIKDFTVTLFATKSQVADKIKCHKNTLINMKDRITHADYIVIAANAIMPTRGKHR